MKLSPQPPRGFVLIAVLVIVGGAILMTTSMLLLYQAQLATTARSADAVQSRMLASSGLQAVMTVLDGQRDEILAGRSPRVDRQYLVYESPTELGVVRLLATGARRDLLEPEAGKLDLNEIDAAALVSTGFVDSEVAAGIIEYRRSTGGFQSVGELARVPGVTAEMVWGPLEDLTPMDDAMSETADMAERVFSMHEQPSPRGLADLVTVFAFEPNIQRNGRLRINLNVKWSEELANRVQERFGADAAQGLQRIFEAGTVFDSERKVVEVLRFFKVEPKDWPEILDAFTTEQDEYVAGRLDINTASYEALVALSTSNEGGGTPGAAEVPIGTRAVLQPDQAAQIVRMRDEVPPEQRASIAWPVIQGLVPPETYDHLVGRITARCWTYRVRLAAGTVPGDHPDAPLLHPVIYEAVIDLSAPEPRLAELREITLMQTAAALAAFASPAERQTPLEEAEGSTAGSDSLSSTASDQDSMNPDTGNEADAVDGETPALPNEADGSGIDKPEAPESPASSPPPTGTQEPPDTSDPRRGRWKLPG